MKRYCDNSLLSLIVITTALTALIGCGTIPHAVVNATHTCDGAHQQLQGPGYPVKPMPAQHRKEDDVAPQTGFKRPLLN